MRDEGGLVRWVIALVIVFALGALPALARADGEYVLLGRDGPAAMDRLVDEAARADVVFVGEEHDLRAGHSLELELLKRLHARKSGVVLSLEMFERDVQPVLDEYLGGYITQASFLAAARPWPNYKTDYAPLVELCRENRLPVVAANAPRRYVNLVSRKGQEALRGLPRESREWLPRLPYDMALPEGYDRMLTALFEGAHGQSAPSAPSAPSAAATAMPTTAHMKEAQALWDASMADSLARAMAKYRGRTILQVNGSGHSDHGWGIVDRLRRLAPRARIVTVSVKPDAAYPNVPADRYAGVADYVFVTAPQKQQP